MDFLKLSDSRFAQEAPDLQQIIFGCFGTVPGHRDTIFYSLLGLDQLLGRELMGIPAFFCPLEKPVGWQKIGL